MVSASRARESTRLSLAVSMRVYAVAAARRWRGTDEEAVSAAECDGPHGAFGGVVVGLPATVGEVWPEPFHPGERGAGGPGQMEYSRDRWQLGVRPAPEVIEDRSRLGRSNRGALIGWRSSPLLLDAVELSGARDRLFGDGGALEAVRVRELAPDMQCPAGACEAGCREGPCRRPP